MRLRQQLAGLWSRLRWGRRTVRLRLTLLYGGLFLAWGAGLLGVTYLLAATHFAVRTHGPLPHASSTLGPVSLPVSARPPPDKWWPHIGAVPVELWQSLIQSGTALAIMAVVAIALGWLVAGRILRPLRTMTATTRQISEDNLHQRLDLRGPSDELKDLADTIDGLLGRLEGAFDAQRRFVANASHELRTPLTFQRALLEVALADPGATVESLRSTCERVLAEGEKQERLIEALLTLARGQGGLDHRQRIDLAALTREVLLAHQPEARRRGLRVEASLDPTATSGDPRLVERLVANLVENALRHNVPQGRVQVATATRGDRAVLLVTNTGPIVPAGQIQRLLQPFQRLAVDRAAGRDGLGLGLSIVAVIARAHGSALRARPGGEGGLEMEVSFPAAILSGELRELPLAADYPNVQ